MTDRELAEKALTLAEQAIASATDAWSKSRESAGSHAAALAALDKMTIEVDQLRELSAAKPHTETVQ